MNEKSYDEQGFILTFMFPTTLIQTQTFSGRTERTVFKSKEGL